MTKENKIKSLLDSAKVYEQVLAKMPQDRFSIEALLEIYEEIGDQVKISEFKERLDKLNNGEVIKVPKNTIKSRTSSYSISVNMSKVNNKIVNLKSRPVVLTPIPLGERKKNQDLEQIRCNKAFADIVFTLHYFLKSQVDLLIRLADLGLISKKHLTFAMTKLAEHKFSREPGKPQMVIHFLEECDGVDLEKIHLFLSKKTSLPYIDLTVFEFDEKLYELLPETLIFNHGILIFRKLGDGYCVAVLNPLNSELMEKVVTQLGTKVYFYITSAREFDNFIKKGVK